MSDLFLDINGDLDLTGNDFNLVSGAAFIGQTLQIKLATFLGEYFTDIERGIDYRTFLSTKPEQLAEIDSAIKREIQETEGVLPAPDGIQKFIMDYDRVNRRASINAYIRTDQGFIDLDIKGLNIGGEVGGGGNVVDPLANVDFAINFEADEGWQDYALDLLIDFEDDEGW